jgi:hypothetical protein
MSHSKLTLDDVADVLWEALMPFSKGIPMGQKPQFRKTLTGEEANNLLNTMYQLYVTIKLDEREIVEPPAVV